MDQTAAKKGIEDAEGDEAPPRDRPFNPYRLPRNDRVKVVVADVLNQVQNYEKHFGLRKRKRKPADQGTFEATVSAIVCDLMHHQLTGSAGGVAITRSNTILGRRSRYRPVAYGKALPAILDRLTTPEMAFVEQDVGYEGIFGPSRQTTIRPGKRLLTRIEDHRIGIDDLGMSDHQEVIILKRTKEDYWDEGGLKEYDDTRTIRHYREQVQTINAYLEGADIAFDESVVEDGRLVDETDRRLRRIFTQDSFESGGRLFGGFWQNIGKTARREGVIIDGEAVATLDYSQMNPRILYGLAEATPPEEDVYLLPGLEDYRSGVKKVMNAMLFATKPITRMPKGVRKEFSEMVSVRKVMDKVIEAHPALGDHFFTGIGHRMQFIESQIMVDLLLDFRDKGIVALPVHDAVIVPGCSISEVKERMLSIFQEHTGAEGLVREEEV